MRQALQELTDQAEERMFNAVQGEGTKQAGLKLFVGLKSFELLSKMKAKRDSIIFAALVASHHDLDENERNELVSTYWRWAKSGPSWLRGRPPFDRKSLNKDH